MIDPAGISGSEAVVARPGVRRAVARAWIPAESVSPVSGGTATRALPVETVTLIVAPNATVVLAAGSCWTIVPSGWSLLLMNWSGRG